MLTLFRRALIVSVLLWLVAPIASHAQSGDLDVLNRQVEQFYRQGKYAEATEIAQRALELAEKTFGSDHPDVAKTLNNLAVLYENQGRYAEAETMAREALQILAPVYPKDHVEISEARSILGASLMGLKRYAEAEPLLLESYTILRGTLGEGLPSVRKARDRLIALYEAWGKPDRVAEYRALSGT